MLCVYSERAPKHILTARKRSLGQGNVFTSVCHSVRGVGWLPNMHHRSHHITEPPPAWCRVNKRAVRILLECILVIPIDTQVHSCFKLGCDGQIANFIYMYTLQVKCGSYKGSL